MQACGNTDALQASREEAEANLAAEKAQFDSICVMAEQMRQSHLEGLAEALAKKNGSTTEAEF